MKLYLVVKETWGIKFFTMFTDKHEAIKYVDSLPNTDRHTKGMYAIYEYEAGLQIETRGGYDEKVYLYLNGKPTFEIDEIYKREIIKV